MSTLSNSQGLMFAELSTQETKELQATTLQGWFGAQQTGQARATITDAVNACRGVVTHTVGEAMLSSFPDAKQTMKAALEVKRRLAKAQNPTAGIVVTVRIGLAFGPVRVIAGKVSGDAVQAAGMLLEKAKPGEILVDQALKDALGASAEVRLLPYGRVDGITAYRVAEQTAPDALTKILKIPARPDLAPAKEAPAPPPLVPRPAPPPLVPRPAPPPLEPRPAPLAAASAPLVLRYGGAEHRFRPADGEVSLGRALENHVNVPVVHVSRKHAKIVWDGLVPYLVNLSQNGTCVRFDGSGRQQTCDERIRLEGSGAIALAGRFGESPSGADIVKFAVFG